MVYILISSANWLKLKFNLLQYRCNVGDLSNIINLRTKLRYDDCKILNKYLIKLIKPKIELFEAAVNLRYRNLSVLIQLLF